MTSDDDPRPSDGEPIGSVGEEAAKLLGALSDWARENGGSYTDAASGMAAGAASTLGNLNDHVATGGRECRYCPLCQAIATVRATSPEVKAHLAAAATSLMSAVASAMGTDVPPRREQGGAPVERIDLADDGWDED